MPSKLIQFLALCAATIATITADALPSSAGSDDISDILAQAERNIV